MKVIIKIDEYLEDENYIIFRIARLNSHKKIDDHRTFSVDCSDLDTTDTESFVDSLIFKYKHLIQEQDENQDLLKENEPVNVDEFLINICLLYTSPSPRDGRISRMPSSA